MRRIMLSWSMAIAVSGLTLMSCNNDKDDNKPNLTPTSFTDKRDQKTYKLVTIGEQTWFAENLAYADGSSICANDSCDKYGRLYTGLAAKVLCPEGYHLPTDAEWRTLEHNLGMSNEDTAQVGLAMERGVVQAIGIKLAKGGSSRFNALVFREETKFWAANTAPGFEGHQYFRQLQPNDSSFYRSFNSKPSESSLCVRCLLD